MLQQEHQVAVELPAQENELLGKARRKYKGTLKMVLKFLAWITGQ